MVIIPFLLWPPCINSAQTDTLKDPYVLPPRRLLITYFLPAAWVDDTLISERKVGLARWLSNLINSAEYRDNPLLLQFLTVSNSSVHVKFNLEDALPSTLSRKVALQLKAELDAEEERSMAATSPSASNEADSTSPSAEAAGPIAASYFTGPSAHKFILLNNNSNPHSLECRAKYARKN